MWLATPVSELIAIGALKSTLYFLHVAKAVDKTSCVQVYNTCIPHEPHC